MSREVIISTRIGAFFYALAPIHFLGSNLDLGLYRLSEPRIFDSEAGTVKSLKAGSNFTLKKDISCPDNGEGFIQIIFIC